MSEANGPKFSDTAFKYFLSNEKLMGCRCKECNAVYLPPKPICTKCFGYDLEWVEIAPHGKLVAFTCIAIGPPGMVAEGYNRKNPYCSGVVEVDKGLRLDARIEGVDANRPEQIKIGMEMKIKFLHRNKDGIKSTIITFRPVE